LGAVISIPVCSICGKRSAKERLPVGWKRLGEAIYCAADWRERYLLRAISMPVAEPLDGISWQDLRRDLKRMWVETTEASNWMVTQLYVRDVRREAGQAKMPPMPRVYLYPELRELFPDLPPPTVVSLEHAIQLKYRARRYEIIWTHRTSLPTHRYPVPFPVHNQSWSAELENDRPVVRIRLGDGWRRLRLKSGAQFHRQLAAFRQMANGEAVRGELAIYQPGDQLMVKMVAWLERPEAARKRTGVLEVRTATDRLLVAVNAKDETIWSYNGDHLRRWGAEHRTQLQRWSEDAKFENRPVPSFAARREAAAAKYHRRMESAAHEIAAQLAGYAVRRRFAVVRYDDSVRSYLGQAGPWARLKGLIAEKLDAAGIRLELVASAPATQKTPEALANEGNHEK
jgi:hypothetical protein